MSYAIAFAMDTVQLQQMYPDPKAWQTAYADIKRILQAQGFDWQQGCVYFGGDKINAVTCVVAAQKLSKELPWFKDCVRDIRMLRIEELNDLLPAL